MHLSSVQVTSAALLTLALVCTALPTEGVKRRTADGLAPTHTLRNTPDNPQAPTEALRKTPVEARNEALRNATVITARHRVKRSFYDLQCKGVYDQVMFNRLDRVCDDCYNLFQNSELFKLCRADCFTTHYFKACVEALLKEDQMDTYKKYIKHLHGVDPKL